MKKLLLFAGLISATLTQAQLTLIDVTGAAEFNLSQRDFPGIPQQYTQMKIWIPSPTQTGDIVWYTLNPTFNASNVLSAYEFRDINAGYPISNETRIANFTNSGNSYTYTIEANDGGIWMPDSRQTVYYDANGNDTLWELESYNGMTFEKEGKANLNFNSNNQFVGFIFSQWDGSEYLPIMERKITYNGTKRIEDKTTAIEEGFEIDFASHSYFYDANNRLDSLVYSEFNESTLDLEPLYAYNVKTSSNGAITDIIAYENDVEFEYIWRTTFTGGTSGLAKNELLNTRIYPNPASNKVTIQLGNTKAAKVEVFDYQGKLQLTQKVTNLAEINTQNLTKGIYLFVLTDKEGKTAQHRIVVGE